MRKVSSPRRYLTDGEHTRAHLERWGRQRRQRDLSTRLAVCLSPGGGGGGGDDRLSWMCSRRARVGIQSHRVGYVWCAWERSSSLWPTDGLLPPPTPSYLTSYLIPGRSTNIVLDAQVASPGFHPMSHPGTQNCTWGRGGGGAVSGV